ncbi:helix-turn-helix domain-containing protein [Sphingobacterium spiritivorum]|uniref:helix-turn-helix domain-containing protein n=1 Tax=Sphingobacterium spiritivorum TaxID=258 RepID=UPI003DA4B605
MNNKITAKLRALRASHQYTQEYVAAELNISQKAYSKIERGTTSLTINHLTKLATVYNVKIGYFFE